MKKQIIFTLLALVMTLPVFAQYKKSEGTCGTDVKWTFDGYTLTVRNVNQKGFIESIENYDLKSNLAPWKKKGLDVRKIVIERGIDRIGSCAFANLPNLQEVVFMGDDLTEIGWGAFINDVSLRTISIPFSVKNIETIAFANCTSLTSINIPDQCRVGDKAFLSCNNLKSVDLSPNAVLGYMVFAKEEKINGKVHNTLYTGELKRIPSYINAENCAEYGISKTSVEKISSNPAMAIDYDYKTSYLDSIIPNGHRKRNDTYALIIGNQNYRFVSDVPYAIHDARTFSEYCQKTLGIPAGNIHLTEDATKQMIVEEELEDWLGSIANKENKNLIVYYAGHGVPDVKNNNKAYLLPTDVRGTNAKRGIPLDELYQKLGDMDFNQCTVFLDACFSGVNRNNEGVTEGLRGVEIEAENAELGGGSMVVFSAAQGNETAQGYPEEGHGLFTYYLLDALNSSRGEIYLGDLADIIENNVSQKANQLKLRKPQTPSTNASDKVANYWRSIKF